MKPVECASLYVDSFSPPYEGLVQALVRACEDCGVELFVSTASASAFEGKDLQEKDRCDAALVVGGDGTILRGIDHFRKLKVPVLGINTGHLGFLASVESEDMLAALRKLSEGEYTEHDLTLLSGTMPDGRKLTAVNDLCMNRSMMSGILHLEMLVEEELIARVAGDGVVVATPTGSTAYALSAGGPILDPDLPAMLVVPIAPHQLSLRPVVLPHDVTVILKTGKVRGSGPFVSADGAPVGNLKAGEELAVTTSSDYCKVVRLKSWGGYYGRLGKKLGWGARG
jgi:NAD+ kinase